MKKRICIAFITMLAAISLMGCGADEFPELTEEQTVLVTEYAAALLLRYDTNTTSRLLPESEGSKVLNIEILPTSSEPSQENIPLVAEDDVVVTDVEEGTEKRPEAEYVGFDSFVDESFEIQYAGNYELTDSYPKDAGNVYFTTDAAPGKTLMVIHFNLINKTGDSIDVNMNKYKLKYRVSVDGGKNKSVLTTMLDNDILSYVGTVEAGGSVDLIAIVEGDEEEFANVSTLDFTIKGEDHSATMILQ